MVILAMFSMKQIASTVWLCKELLHCGIYQSSPAWLVNDFSLTPWRKQVWGWGSKGGAVVRAFASHQWGFFSRYSVFPLSSKTNTSKFQFDLERTSLPRRPSFGSSRNPPPTNVGQERVMKPQERLRGRLGTHGHTFLGTPKCFLGKQITKNNNSKKKILW